MSGQSGSGNASTNTNTVKSAKKLAPFFKENVSNSKKYHVLQSFLEAIEQTPDEVDFFQKYPDKTFKVLFDRFTYKCNKHTASGGKLGGKPIKDVLNLLLLFKRIVRCLPVMLQSKWEMDRIMIVLKKCLARASHPQIRFAAFEVLLLYIEALQNSVSEEQFFLFSLAIDLDVFVPASPPPQSSQPSSVSFKWVPSHEAPLFPKGEPGSNKDSISLITFFLDYIPKSDVFSFWFNLFKEKYMSQLYPRVFQELRLIDPNDRHGFLDSCPEEVQKALIDAFVVWGNDPDIFSELWDPTHNGPIMMEIHRQACCLPLRYNDTMHKGIELYKGWLLDFQKNDIFGDKLQSYWQQYSKNVVQVFSAHLSGPGEIDILYDLSKQVMFVYNNFIVDLFEKLTKETWERLQYTWLFGVFDLVDRTNKASNNFNQFVLDLLISKESTSNSSAITNKKWTRHCFSEDLFASLYFSWIRTQPPEAMWQDLGSKLTAMAFHEPNVKQWSSHLLQLTEILREIIYFPLFPQDSGRVTERRGTIKRTPSRYVKSPLGMEKPTLGLTTTPSKENSPFSPANTELKNAIEWNRENIEKTWYTMLRLLGNVTKLPHAPSHLIAMKCISEIVHLLTDAEDRILPEVLAKNQVIPIFQVFLPMLISGCTYEEKFLEGILVSFRVICFIFCKNHRFDSIVRTHKSHPSVLVHFYRVIQAGLSCLNSHVRWEIILNCSSLFSRDLPGSAVLIPDFLTEAEAILSPHSKAPPLVMEHAMTLINSIICFPYHFSSDTFPVVEVAKPYEDRKEAGLAPLELKRKILDIILMVSKDRYGDLGLLMAALSGCSVFLHCEVEYSRNSAQEIDRSLLGKCLSAAVNSCCHHHQQSLVNMAAETVGDMSMFFEYFDGRSIKSAVIKPLCKRITEIIAAATEASQANSVPQPTSSVNSQSGSIEDNTPKGSHSPQSNPKPPSSPVSQGTYTTFPSALKPLSQLIDHVPALFFCVRDWLLASNNSLLTDCEIASLVFSTLENGLFGLIAPIPQDYYPFSSIFMRSHSSDSFSPPGDQSSPGKIFFLMKKKAKGDLQIEDAGASFGSLINAPEHGSPITREAAEEVIFQLLYLYNNFPGKSGPETTSTPIPPKHSDEIAFLFNDASIFTLSPLDMDKDQRGDQGCRLTIRDCIGRYTWDFRLEHRPEILPTRVPRTQDPITTRKEDKLELGQKSELSPKGVPTFHDKKPGMDMTTEFLQYLSSNFPETHPTSKPTNILSPDPISDSLDLQIDAIRSVVEEERSTSTAALEIQPVDCVFPRHFPSLSKFHPCRLFLGHLGLLRSGKLSLLDAGPNYFRSLKELDSLLWNREVFKIGVIYVGNRQEDQSTILKNEEGSSDFQDLVPSLGWIIDVNKHPGFLGGLDPKTLSSGRFAPYFCTPSFEVLFHVPTMMPTSTTDKMQVEKKKHIGNDSVHIIWNDHWKDYKPDTILGTTDVHIVLSPLKHCLFKVDILRNQKLSSGMVVSKCVLPNLLRQTAVNCSRLSRSHIRGFKRPFAARAAMIQEIAERYKLQEILDISNLFPTEQNPYQPVGGPVGLPEGLMKTQF